VGDEQGLQLGRGYLEAPVLDDLLAPVYDEDLIVVVHVPDVAGVQLPVGIDGVLRGLRVVQVTWLITGRDSISSLHLRVLLKTDHGA
jgi:hypothetical protein